MKSKLLYPILAIAIVAAALAVGAYQLSRPSNAGAGIDSGNGQPTAFAYGNDNNAPSERGFKDSSSRVGIDARLVKPGSGDGSRRLRVRLHIAKGWHVNANPASMKALIPTTVQARINGKRAPLRVKYPSGRDSNIHLGDKTIKVYDDNTTISAVLTPAALKAAQSGGLDVLVRVQSCSDRGVCLAPARLTTQLPRS
jgi:hypothetical protein